MHVNTVLACNHISYHEFYLHRLQKSPMTLISNRRTMDSRGLSPYLGRLTGIGAMRGIELSHADGTPASAQLTQLLALARESGLLLMPSGKSRHIVRLLAPLTTEPAVLEEGLDILEACLAKLA